MSICCVHRVTPATPWKEWPRERGTRRTGRASWSAYMDDTILCPQPVSMIMRLLDALATAAMQLGDMTPDDIQCERHCGYAAAYSNNDMTQEGFDRGVSVRLRTSSASYTCRDESNTCTLSSPKMTHTHGSSTPLPPSAA